MIEYLPERSKYNTPTVAEAIELFKGTLNELVPTTFIKEKKERLTKACSVPMSISILMFSEKPKTSG